MYFCIHLRFGENFPGTCSWVLTATGASASKNSFHFSSVNSFRRLFTTEAHQLTCLTPKYRMGTQPIFETHLGSEPVPRSDSKIGDACPAE